MKITSLTHEVDLDGIGSQAIIKRYFNIKENINKEDIHLFYAHYTNFKQKIKEILDISNKPDIFIITDIGFNESFIELFSLFEESMNSGCKIYWFDHHIVENSIVKRLRGLLEIYLNDDQKCSAEIVKDYYLPDDTIAQRIAKFAHDTDFGDNNYTIASQIQSIISYNRGQKYNKNKKRIVNLLSEGKFENEWFTDQTNKLRRWEQTQYKRAESNKRSIVIENIGEVLVSHAKIGAGRIAKVLKKQNPDKKAYIGIDTRYNELVVYSDAINCRDLARTFNGGGHRDRAGFKYENIVKNGTINCGFLEKLKSEIQKGKY
ncbi:MAG: hypothetical protein BAJALOKI3v1_780004 [Promethearchaeota archaeon]|nr:MAG: hypothetical protein BAJALOKI3v1_780004 [Candidatus Lokiarchaeota archaeon]